MTSSFILRHTSAITDPRSKSPHYPKSLPPLLLTRKATSPTSAQYISHRILCCTPTSTRDTASKGQGCAVLPVASSCRCMVLDVRAYRHCYWSWGMFRMQACHFSVEFWALVITLCVRKRNHGSQEPICGAGAGDSSVIRSQAQRFMEEQRFGPRQAAVFQHNIVHSMQSANLRSVLPFLTSHATHIFRHVHEIVQWNM